MRYKLTVNLSGDIMKKTIIMLQFGDMYLFRRRTQWILIYLKSIWKCKKEHVNL